MPFPILFEYECITIAGDTAQTPLYDPQGVAVDPTGRIVYFTNYKPFIANDIGSVWMIDQSSGEVTLFAGPGHGAVYKITDMLGPDGITVDKDGNVWVSDNTWVWMFPPVSPGSAGNPNNVKQYVPAGDTTNSLSFFPYGLAADANGNIYCANVGNGGLGEYFYPNLVYILNEKAESFKPFAGSGPYGFSGDGRAALLAELTSPMGVAVDGRGNVYIADTGNNRIREVSMATNEINTIAGQSSPGTISETGPAVDAYLNNPRDVAFDNNGNCLYVAELNRILKIENGEMSIFAGAASFGPMSLSAVTVDLSDPTGIDVDLNGNLYIADSGNNRILKVQKKSIFSL